MQGSFEQLTPTTLARWKRENKPETTRTESTPTASPKVSYQESAQHSGESDSEQEEENPFSEEEKEEELEYAPGVISITIPTIEQQREDKKSAEVIAALSLVTEPKPEPTTTFFSASEFTNSLAPGPSFFEKEKWKAEDEMSGSASGSREPCSSKSKSDPMKIKAPGTFEGDRTKLNSFLSKCNLYIAYYKLKDD
jgi:hypothetical protein